MKTDYYFLDVKSSDLKTHVGVNDVYVINDPLAEGITTVEPLNRWLKPSDNVFQIYIDWPKDREFIPGVGKVTAKLFLHDPQAETPTPQRMLAEFTWPSEDIPIKYPFTLKQEFDIENPPITRLWQDAEIIEELTDADKRTLLDLAAKLRSSLLDRNTDSVVDLMKFKFAEDAASEAKPYEQVNNACIELYEWLFKQNPLEAEDITADSISFSIVAQGRLVQMMYKGIEPAVVLENRDTGQCFGFEMYCAKMNNQWIIAR